MLSPDYLQELPESIISLYSEAEIAVLKDMARRISTYDYWIPAVEHQKRMLTEAGRTTDEILKVLTSHTGRSQRELKQLMQEAATRSISADAEIYNAAGMKAPSVKDSKTLKGILNAGYKATASEMRNLCRTTAKLGSQQLVEALDSAWLQVHTGATDANSAIRQAVKRLSEDGLKVIRYSSGRKDTLEVAVRRATVTGINQTCCQLQEELADEVGCDLVEVSAHAGARPSHALWQGKIYSRSGKSDKYPSFRAATGYGTGAGLGGWNCRHTFGPYIEGSPPVWTDDELRKLEEPQYDYNGKKLTEYEAQQEQRKNERSIRRWKREYAAMDAAGQDTTEAAVELKSARAKQIDFIRQTGLKPQGDREQVAGFGRKSASVATAEAKTARSVADSLFSLGSPDENMREYLREKPTIDMLAKEGVQYKQRISATEIIVDAGHPKIIGCTAHALENQHNRPDRASMTVERAQEFVDNVKITLYQQEKGTLKFLSQEGYAAINFKHELVTAVPQKWRGKYDKYLGGTQNETP